MVAWTVLEVTVCHPAASSGHRIPKEGLLPTAKSPFAKGRGGPAGGTEACGGVGEVVMAR